MIATRKRSPLADELSMFCETARSRAVRTIREFAEQEIVLPMDGGPHQGQRFSVATQPVAGIILDELTKREYSEYYITGPSQSGKTLISFVVPIAYYASELRRNLVVAVPDMNMADNKWQIDIKPVFLESPTLRALLPDKGMASKGGKIKDTIRLKNGVVMKFMSPFGDDANRAGFTATIVLVTEAARFSNPSETSVESDPLRQLKARQRSMSRFTKDGELNTDRAMVIEGTVTLDHELPWSARQNSTKSKIVCQCLWCKSWVCPERDDLIGWQDAATELEAARSAFFACPSCGEKISEDDREVMNRKAKIIHDGQSIDDQGDVVGEAKQTTKFWIRWNAFNNQFTTAADLGLEEWNAAQLDEDSGEKINAEKDLCQSVWCIPYKGDLQIDAAPLRAADVAKRQDKFQVGTLPEDTQFLSVGVDVGRWNCWFFVLAWRENGTIHCPLYGAHDTSLVRDDGLTPELEHVAIRNALNEMHDRFELGFPVRGSGIIKKPDIVFIDSNYMTDAVFEFARGLHDKPVMPMKSRYYPVLGRGQTQREKYQYKGPTKTGAEVRKIGHGWHLAHERARRAWRVVVDADAAKLLVQDGLRVTYPNPGAITLFEATAREHSRVSRHLASEVRTTTLDPVKGIVTVWKKTGANHLLDCAGYAYMGGKFLGWTPRAAEKQPPSKEEQPTKKSSWLERVVS